MSGLSERPADAVVGWEIPHESAALHVTGAALYTDDLVGRTRDCLHAWPVQAPHAHARVTDLRVEAAYDVPGVVRVLTADDVPGVNDAGVKDDEPLFPTEVMYYGHAVCWVLGETLEAARLGAAAVEVDYEPLPALVDLREAIAAGSFQGGKPQVVRGDVEAALAGSAHVFSGETEMAGQEHFYLETHCSLVHVDESGQVFVQSSTQHPTRDAGDRGPRARPAQPRRHRAVPADGRRLRRQGDAAARVRRDRGARRDPHRPPGPAAAEPHPGHDDDRQAARLPRPVAGRVRRRGPAAGARRHADLRRRLEPRPVASRCWPGRCATSTTPTGSRTCGRTAGSRRPTRPRRPRSAASAARRGCS